MVNLQDKGKAVCVSGDTHSWSADTIEEEDLNTRNERINYGEVYDAERFDVVLLEQALVCLLESVS